MDIGIVEHNHKGYRTTASLRPTALTPTTRNPPRAERTKHIKTRDITPVERNNKGFRTTALLRPTALTPTTKTPPRARRIKHIEPGNEMKEEAPVRIAEPVDFNKTPAVIRQRQAEHQTNRIVLRPSFSSMAADQKDNKKDSGGEEETQRAKKRAAGPRNVEEELESLAADKLEKLIPPQVLELARAEQHTTSDHMSKSAKKGKKGTVDEAAEPSQQAVVMTAARNMIMHLSKNGHATEGMGTELGRIAKDRGDKVAMLEKEVDMLKGTTVTFAAGK